MSVVPEIVRWEHPPPRQYRGGHGDADTVHDWSAIVAVLRGRPRAWARVATYRDARSAGSIADQLRKGLLKATMPARSIEAVARTVDGKYHVYARYVGGAR